MLNTTLCYILRGNEVLMLHRTKKKNDLNQDKWIGIGGNFEEGESPDECLLREAKEAGCKGGNRPEADFLAVPWRGHLLNQRPMGRGIYVPVHC